MRDITVPHAGPPGSSSAPEAILLSRLCEIVERQTVDHDGVLCVLSAPSAAMSGFVLVFREFAAQLPLQKFRVHEMMNKP